MFPRRASTFSTCSFLSALMHSKHTLQARACDLLQGSVQQVVISCVLCKASVPAFLGLLYEVLLYL